MGLKRSILAEDWEWLGKRRDLDVAIRQAEGVLALYCPFARQRALIFLARSSRRGLRPDEQGS